MSKAEILSIDRLRMGTDGAGVTTLVAFHGCPLRCRFCINDQCHESGLGRTLSSADLFKRVKIDQIYFLATGGGVTFGGGEPLQHSLFIEDFLKLGGNRWHTTLETSLNVPLEQWQSLIESIDHYIVDVKDMNPDIYKEYTGCENKYVIENLTELQRLGMADRVLLRLPLIEGFNDPNDVRRSRRILEDMGFTNFDEFSYRII